MIDLRSVVVAGTADPARRQRAADAEVQVVGENRGSHALSGRRGEDRAPPRPGAGVQRAAADVVHQVQAAGVADDPATGLGLPVDRVPAAAWPECQPLRGLLGFIIDCPDPMKLATF